MLGWERWIFSPSESNVELVNLRQGTGKVKLLFSTAFLGGVWSEWLGQLSRKETAKAGGRAGEMGSAAEAGIDQENRRRGRGWS